MALTGFRRESKEKYNEMLKKLKLQNGREN